MVAGVPDVTALRGVVRLPAASSLLCVFVSFSPLQSARYQHPVWLVLPFSVAVVRTSIRGIGTAASRFGEHLGTVSG